MRHLIANIATYTIAALLLCGAGVFALVRSSQLTITDESTLLGRHLPAPERDREWRELGALSYQRNCANCHGDAGEGWDQYPALAHAAAIFHAPGGREYLIDVHLHGLASPRWRAPMPPMRHMVDVELAACVNHVLTSFGNETELEPGAKLFTPEEIAGRRGMQRSPSSVNQGRPVMVHIRTSP
ncbi:MAG: cytochrome c [Thermoanaerobaculia bacterium]